MTESVLGIQTLNRALLQRQLLIERADLNTEQAVAHLVGLQAQAVNPPYIGLWTRLNGFRLGDLESVLIDRRLVRIALQRSTIHLVTADDARKLRTVLAESLARTVKGQFGRAVEGVDLGELVSRASELVAAEPLTFADLGRSLAGRWPQNDPNALAQTTRNLLPLVQVPPRGLWSNSSAATHTTLTNWLGRDLDPDAEADEFVLRYLDAFGPASVLDMQKWSGLTRLKPVFARLGDALRIYRDDEGKELYDLNQRTLPAADLPVPVRFLPEFDNILLSHSHRRRIMAEKYKPLVFTSNGIIRSTFLIDGFVRGRWRVDRTRAGATLVVEPFEKLSSNGRSELAEEGERLLSFVAADAARRDLRFEPV